MKTYTVSGFNIMEYEELDSTNTMAMQLPHADLKDKTVILTYRQTHGKGQAENKWESEPGRNLSMTIIFCPQRFDAGRQFAISMVIALGCRDFVEHYANHCTIKWPNDIYVEDRKISGILIEHTVSGPYIGFSICGIGVNINQRGFLSDAPNPVSLFQLTGNELDLNIALEQFLECIGNWYDKLFDYEALENAYLKGMYRRDGKFYDWQDEHGKFRAVVEGVDEYGQLLLRDEEDICRVYAFKEVAWL